MTRSYSELILLPTFKERFEYLQLNGQVAQETFGFDRYLNQKFYTSQKWKSLRNQIIIRDNGCDLGIEGFEIFGKILIHHMNPVSMDDIVRNTDFLLNPEFLVCVSLDTHNAIHYGDFSFVPKGPAERSPNDMCPWRK